MRGLVTGRKRFFLAVITLGISSFMLLLMYRLTETTLYKTRIIPAHYPLHQQQLSQEGHKSLDENYDDIGFKQHLPSGNLPYDMRHVTKPTTENNALNSEVGIIAHNKSITKRREQMSDVEIEMMEVRKIIRSQWNELDAAKKRKESAKVADAESVVILEQLKGMEQTLETDMKKIEKWTAEEERRLSIDRQRQMSERWKLEEDKENFREQIRRVKEHLKVTGKFPSKIDLSNISLPAANPLWWEGLDGRVVGKRFPGINFFPDYRLRDFVDGGDPKAAGMQGHPKDITELSDYQAEERFYQLVTSLHMECVEMKRMGNAGDGGWDICVSHPYKPLPGCIVYSFGINNDFSFDDAMAKDFGCQVRAFDPSMSLGDFQRSEKVFFYQLGLGAANTVNEGGWKLETMGSILSKLGHSNKILDVLKMDIEHNEWGCLKTMLKEGVLPRVRQLLLEIHTPEVNTVHRPSTKEDFVNMYAILQELEKLGFRRFHHHPNPTGGYISVRTGRQRTCCYELFYVNIRFMKT